MDWAPERIESWHALGDMFAARGDPDRAALALAQQRYCMCSEDLIRAAAALRADCPDEAARFVRARLRTTPNDVAALLLLARLAQRAGNLDDALAVAERCLALAPDCLNARYASAAVRSELGDQDLALTQVNVLCRFDEVNPNYRNLKAVVLDRCGDYGAAADVYRDLLRDFPESAGTWHQYGHVLGALGEQVLAVDAYRSALRLAPQSAAPWWSLADLKTFRFTADDVAEMRAQLASSALTPDDRCRLEFALGKAREDAGDHAQSFAHYARGNAQYRERIEYDARATSARAARLCKVFTREFIDARRDAGIAASDPIFIVGLPRSGSTLVEQMLSCHSQIEGTMELATLGALVRQLDDAASPPELRRLGEQYLARTRIYRKSAKPLFIDKMGANFWHVGLIRLALPNAKIIDVRRHPLACGFSIFKQYFARGNEFAYSLEDIGRYYRDYAALMAHFDELLPGRVHHVGYEALVERPETEVRRMLEYCGLAFESNCLRFHENDRAVRTASSAQVRQSLNRSGLEQWRRYETWLAPLKAALEG